MAEAENATAGESHKQGKPAAAANYALAVTLSALAGFVDASGYIHFHHLFVSFMSGNSTQTMVAAAGGDLSKVEVVGRTIVLFISGVVLGEIVGVISKRWESSLVLVIETALLGAALASLQLGLGEGWTAGLLALAMGVQNAAVHNAEGISVALTYVTGTLVHVGRSLAHALRGKAPWHAALPFLGLWIGLAVGGLAGAAIAGRSLALALTVAASTGLVLLLCTVASAVIAPEER